MAGATSVGKIPNMRFPDPTPNFDVFWGFPPKKP